MNTKAIAHPVAELSAVSMSFKTAGGHELKVLENIDLAVNQGELLALLASALNISDPLVLTGS